MTFLFLLFGYTQAGVVQLSLDGDVPCKLLEVEQAVASLHHTAVPKPSYR